MTTFLSKTQLDALVLVFKQHGWNAGKAAYNTLLPSDRAYVKAGLEA